MLNRLKKDYEMIKRDPPSNCSAWLVDKKNYRHWKAHIYGPANSPYHGGVFELDIKYGIEYPIQPPKVEFITPIFHPNIDEHGNICLDILKDNWSPALDATSVLLSICSLLVDPNPDDPLDPIAARLYKEDKEKYNETVRAHVMNNASN